MKGVRALNQESNHACAELQDDAGTKAQGDRRQEFPATVTEAMLGCIDEPESKCTMTTARMLVKAAADL